MHQTKVETAPSETKSTNSEPRPDDLQSVEINAVLKIYDPNTQETILETRG
jgi:hypothetical protein